MTKDMAGANTVTRLAPTLGVLGLPAFAGGMNAGGVYVLSTETPPARISVLAGALSSASAPGQAATLIVAGNPEEFIARLAGNGLPNVMERIEAGRLSVFVQQQDFNKKIFRNGAGLLINEFRHFGFPDGGLLVFDNADELLSLNDLALAREQIEVLRRWADETGSIVLLSFTQLATSQQAMRTLTALADHLAGIARLDAGDDGLQLTLDYWQSPHGAVAAQSYPLQREAHGYAVVAAPTGPSPVPQAMPSPAAADNVYCHMDRMFDALASESAGTWNYRDSLIGLMQVCQGLRTPTVLLTCSTETSMRELAQAVHTLRISVGRGAKILVFERDVSLRYANEALLLSLGANLIVHRGTPSSRWLLAVQSVQGQMFDRGINVDFDAALASVSVTALRGYLPPKQLAQEAMLILERAAVLNVPGALVIAQAERDLAIEDILANCRLGRAGDLLTCDGKQAYFFFAGCPPTSTRMTLDRALGVSAGSVLAEITTLVTRDEITAALADLTRRANSEAMPDLRERLAATTESRSVSTERQTYRNTLPISRAGRTDRSDAAPHPAPPEREWAEEPIDLQRFRYGGRLAAGGGGSKAAMPRARRPNSPDTPGDSA